jgi:hypothetical protein
MATHTVNPDAYTVPTIKIGFAPEHEGHDRQVTVDTAMLQHLHHPCHGGGWTLFFQVPGGHRVEDHFIPVHPRRLGRRGPGQATAQPAAHRQLITEAPSGSISGTVTLTKHHQEKAPSKRGAP